jgi:hypothetical protein
MAYARKRKSTKSPLKRKAFKRSRKDKWTSLKAMVNSTVKKSVNRNLETKRSCFTVTDGNEILHNNFITLDSSLLATTQGTQDPIAGQDFNRIGDEIMLKGVSLKCMVELNERYSDVTFRMMVIKCAKGDDPTRATLFAGLSGNKMIDTINSERYTVMAQKYFKITAPNQGTIGGQIIAGAGTNNAGGVEPTLSRATKIVKIWIPGSKFGKGGKVRYENQSPQPKFFDYRVVIYAYSNFTTLQDVYFVGRVNEYIRQMYYKDA